MNLTTQDMQLLAQAERDMDAGLVPFVVLNGMRNLVSADTMSELGLVSGQQVTPSMMTAIIKKSLADMQAELAIIKAKDSISQRITGKTPCK